jgi:hypothetical protein
MVRFLVYVGSEICPHRGNLLPAGWDDRER